MIDFMSDFKCVLVAQLVERILKYQRFKQNLDVLYYQCTFPGLKFVFEELSHFDVFGNFLLILFRKISKEKFDSTYPLTWSLNDL